MELQQEVQSGRPYIHALNLFSLPSFALNISSVIVRVLSSGDQLSHLLATSKL